MHENIEKINYIQIVFVSISINRDVVLKWKLGQLVGRISSPSNVLVVLQPHCRSIVTVITLSRDIVHKVEESTLQEKSRQVVPFSQT